MQCDDTCAMDDWTNPGRQPAEPSRYSRPEPTADPKVAGTPPAGPGSAVPSYPTHQGTLGSGAPGYSGTPGYSGMPGYPGMPTYPAAPGREPDPLAFPWTGADVTGNQSPSYGPTGGSGGQPAAPGSSPTPTGWGYAYAPDAAPAPAPYLDWSSGYGAAPGPSPAPAPYLDWGPDVPPVPPGRGRRNSGQQRPRRRPGIVPVAFVSVASAVLASVLTVTALMPPAASPAPADTAAPIAAATGTPGTTGTATPGSQPGTVSTRTPLDVVQAVSQTSPAVVTITITGGARGFRNPAAGAGLVASGLTISNDGLILTAYHVVAEGTGFTVSLSDGRDLPAQVAATDTDHDLAVLKVSATGLPAVDPSTSSGLKIGQTLLVLGGAQEGGSGSVSSGILSAINRT